MLRGQLRCIRRGVKLLNSTRYFAVDSNETRKKIVVFGGSGYVGSNVVQAALRSGHEVVSINRNAPAFSDNPHLTYRAGDVLKADDWRDELTGCDAVISCVGCFGSNEKMLRINGDGNVNVITEALLQGVPRVVYVSTVENNLPDFLLRGYFEGKRRAEQALLEAFPEPGTGVVLRPSFIYGHRKVALRNPLSPSSEAALDVPLNLLGRPLELLLSNPLADKLRNVLPGMQAPLAPPISVSDVAAAAVLVAEGAEQTRALCATPPSSRTRNVLAVGDIKQLVANAARHRNTPSPPQGKTPEQSTHVSTAAAGTNVEAAATSSHPSAVDNVEAAAADPAREVTEQSVADEKRGPDNSTGRSV